MASTILTTFLTFMLVCLAILTLILLVIWTVPNFTISAYLYGRFLDPEIGNGFNRIMNSEKVIKLNSIDQLYGTTHKFDGEVVLFEDTFCYIDCNIPKILLMGGCPVTQKLFEYACENVKFVEATE